MAFYTNCTRSAHGLQLQNQERQLLVGWQSNYRLRRVVSFYGEMRFLYTRLSSVIIFTQHLAIISGCFTTFVPRGNMVGFHLA